MFPGAGHLYLKKYITGSLLSAGVAIAIYFLVSTMTKVANDVVASIEAGKISLDINSITQLLTEKLAANEGSTHLAFTVICVLWVVGMIDSCRIAYQLEKSQSTIDTLKE